MPAKLRTKTVIDALQSLRLIPSFTTQFSGDVLPEAILLKNILEEMLCSIDILKNLDNVYNGVQAARPIKALEVPANSKLNAAMEHFTGALAEYTKV